MVVGGIIAETQRRFGSDRSQVEVVSNVNAHASARENLRPSSVEQGEVDDRQQEQDLHVGVLESRARLSMVICKEGVRMRVWGVGERCRVLYGLATKM